MTTKPSREDVFILPFLSAYENGAWADAELTTPDAIDRRNPAVDKLATRTSDGRRLAIEHTIIEPFVGDKEDFAMFAAEFLAIESDGALLVPGRWIQVFVPIGTLQNQSKAAARNAIVQAVHSWIRSNRLALIDGISQHRCEITGIPARPPFTITLTLRVDPLEHNPNEAQGLLHVRRQQVENNLGEVIERALTNKLPKLVNTKADKRILLLERQHMNLFPESMLDEIEKRRSSFSNLALVDEIWILETIFYGTAFGGAYFRFEHYDHGRLAGALNFNGGTLR